MHQSRFVGSTRIKVLLLDNRTAQAMAHIEDLRRLVRRTQGEDSEQYAELVNEEVDAARRARDVERGVKLLADARALVVKRGVPKTHEMFARFLRYEAAFAEIRGDLRAAERAQREALQVLHSIPNTFDIAVAQSELAQMLVARGNRSEASALLAQALPVLQRTVLPQQADLKAAELLASKLKRPNSPERARTR